MRFLVAVLFVLTLSTFAFASDTGSPNGGPIWSNAILNHTHEYTDNDTWVDRYSEYQLKQKMPIGVGADIIVYQPDFRVRQYTYLDSVNVESRYDIANKKASVYVMAHFNLWEAIQRFI